MNRAEVESKHLAELHALAAQAGIPRYRMLRRNELIEKLAGGKAPPEKREERPRRERRQRRPRERREPREPREAREPKGEAESPPWPTPTAAAPERPKRKRRRRFRRRRKGVRVHDLLLPAAGGRQAIVYGESRESCTALLREIAADISKASSGPDPIGLLIDPSPEELADWKRDAPRAEIVAAGQARHAGDAFAQAAARANGGEHVIVLVDSLSRYAEAFADTDAAKELFDSGLGAGATGGSLTVVAAVERSA